MAEDPSLTLLRLLAEGAGPEEMAAVEAPSATQELARRAAGHLAAQRTRERSWRALVDTAEQLASAGHPDRVLDAIVRRARALLGTDLAYLTLSDPERADTYVRATAGVTAASFRSLRVPLGAGLGGKVADTLQPWWTADYQADDRFLRVRSIESGVDDEGLVSVCGAPLLVEGEFVGVLFAAYRSRHTFTPDEVALLSSLASLAAVTLRQSRAREATEQALRDLAEAHHSEQLRRAEIERSAEAHDRFTELVASGGGADDISDLLVGVLGGWNVLFDGDGRRLSVHGSVPSPPPDAGAEDDLLPPSLLEQARSSTRAIVIAERIAVAIRSRSEVLAVLVVGGVDPTPSAQRTIERAAAVTTLLFLFERETAIAREQAMADQLDSLLDGSLSAEDAQRMLRREGVNPEDPFCLVAIRGSASRGRLVSAVGSAVGTGLVGQHGQTVVALVPGGDPGGIAERLVRDLHRSPSVTATAAAVGPLESTAELINAFAEASRTLGAMIALGRTGEGAAAADLGFAGLVTASSPDVAEYVRRALGRLLDYDRERGTDLVATLESYFAAGRSPRHASESLHVHVNTVIQRLDRIGQLLGPDWNSPSNCLELQLALQLRRLLKVL